MKIKEGTILIIPKELKKEYQFLGKDNSIYALSLNDEQLAMAGKIGTVTDIDYYWTRTLGKKLFTINGCYGLWVEDIFDGKFDKNSILYLLQERNKST